MRYFNWNLTRHWKWLKSIMSKKEDWQQKWTEKSWFIQSQIMWSPWEKQQGKAYPVTFYFLEMKNKNERRKWTETKWNCMQVNPGQNTPVERCIMGTPLQFSLPQERTTPSPGTWRCACPVDQWWWCLQMLRLECTPHLCKNHRYDQ